MTHEDTEHTDASEAADETQNELLAKDADDADANKAIKEREWQQGRDEVKSMDGAPRDKEDFPSEGKGEFATFGEDEEPPEGAPAHEGGRISGTGG